MKLEERIDELESRLVKLEKVEKRRKIKSIIILCIYGAIVLCIIAVVWFLYVKIKPYKDQLDSLKNIGSGLKSDTIIGGDSGLSDFDFSDFFGGLFNY